MKRNKFRRHILLNKFVDFKNSTMLFGEHSLKNNLKEQKLKNPNS